MLANDKNESSAFKVRVEDVCLARAEWGGRAACWPGLALTGGKKKGDIVCLLPYKVVLRKYQP